MYCEVIVSLHRSMMANTAIFAWGKGSEGARGSVRCLIRHLYSTEGKSTICERWHQQVQSEEDDIVTVPARSYLGIFARRRRANRRWASCRNMKRTNKGPPAVGTLREEGATRNSQTGLHASPSIFVRPTCPLLPRYVYLPGPRIPSRYS